jgi:hypothetical protein
MFVVIATHRQAIECRQRSLAKPRTSIFWRPRVGRIISDFLEALFFAMSRGGELVLSHSLSGVARFIFQIFNIVTLPEVLLLYLATSLLTVFAIMIQAACHLAVAFFGGRQARVFIRGTGKRIGCGNAEKLSESDLDPVHEGG